MPPRKTPIRKSTKFPKAPTGIAGLDEITGGGLPAGRPTLVSGSAGAGKTMLAVEFLVRGATEFGEPGVFMMFEESAEELTANVRSLGFDLDRLVAEKKILLDHVHIERREIEETGEYDLEHAPAPPVPAPAPELESPRRILIVDDNTDSARSLAMIQRRRGHEARTAFSGPDAVALAAEFLPDVVLLDIGLPGMDGLEVARRLRATPALNGVTLIAMTGYGRDEDRAEARLAGFDEYLVKPVDLGQLRDLLRRRG